VDESVMALLTMKKATEERLRNEKTRMRNELLLKEKDEGG